MSKPLKTQLNTYTTCKHRKPEENKTVNIFKHMNTVNQTKQTHLKPKQQHEQTQNNR